MPRSAKRVKLSLGEEHDDQTVQKNEDTNGLKINEEYARRFEHNKKREERDRLLEKYGNQSPSESDSSSEEEDDQGELVTEALDTEIMATINALRSKDPSIYDKTKHFFTPIEAAQDDDPQAIKQTRKSSKPMYLQDYHRQNLLAGNLDDDHDVPNHAFHTYDQEQEALRKSVTQQMHAAAGHDDDQVASEEDDGLLIKKNKATTTSASATKAPKPQLDVEHADRDPETFLSNFMTARAWVPDQESRFAHLDSDDSEQERMAETFENAYNMRFEDPQTANEKLMSFARDVGKYSARRDEATGRKQRRAKENELKAQSKSQRDREKARLRMLKIDQVEEKVKLIREAAGLGPAEAIDLDEWRHMLEGDWDDSEWGKQMAKNFGDKYYAEEKSDESDAETKTQKSRKLKKPTWDDDIDVGDIEPESLDDSASNSSGGVGADAQNTTEASKRDKTQREVAQDKKRTARQQRAGIEALVDSQMLTEPAASSNDSASHGTMGFRYRETSPSAFGLTARDILFADDKQLNEFAGIKKHHTFRDEEKKRRDQKKLGKKARLRQWRKDTFGNEEGYQGQFADFVRERLGGDDETTAKQDKSAGRHADKKRKASLEKPADGDKKKRRRKKKSSNSSTGANAELRA